MASESSGHKETLERIDRIEQAAVGGAPALPDDVLFLIGVLRGLVIAVETLARAQRRKEE